VNPGTRPVRRAVAAVAAAGALFAAMLAIGPTWARPSLTGADSPLGTQRGPDPTIGMIEATRGPFATSQVSVPSGYGFGGGEIYYPTDTSQGTWGALAIVPGYSALFANEEAWMGPWLSSFGFVVIGIETNTRTDSDSQRASELLAALNYLTTQSPVRNEVDPDRLSVLGHSAGGAGAIEAAEQRPSLRAMIGLAPGYPGNGLSMATDRVPTMIIGGQADTTVTPSYLSNLYATLPSTTQSDFAQIAGASHVYYTHPNNVEMKLLIPWLKVFVDSDTRYTQFLCPSLPDPSTISIYQPRCPYVPPGGSSSPPPTSPPPTSPPPTSPPPTSPPPTSPPPTSPPPSAACTASYQTVNSWPGGYQGQVTVTAGSAAVNGWSVRLSLAPGQQITQVWNGALSTSGSNANVTNASYNGALAAGTSTTFGFLANGTPSTPTLTCTSP
jgi:dienelactone hydrolase